MDQPFYLIVPGKGDSGPGHWQSIWQTRLGARRVAQADWDAPDLVRWTQRLLRELDRVPRPAILIAHSFGCFASVSAAYRRPDRVRALFLAAPANPTRFPNAPALPAERLLPPSLLISSRSDPWLDPAEAQSWARLWGCRHIDGGHVGHINRASGHGEWRAGERWLGELVASSRSKAAPQPATEASLLPATMA